MTIAAGFVCRDGVLLCADSKYSGWDKAYREKLFLHPIGAATVGFAFCGDEDYAKTAIQDSLEALSSIPVPKQTLAEIRKTIRATIRPVLIDYTEQKREPTQKPEFLVAISTPETVQLFSSRDTAFPRIDGFDCRGTGNYLAGYVLRSARFTESATVAEVFPIAVRALAAAKRHDDACGGGSQFVVLRKHSATAVIGYDLDSSDTTIGEFERWSTLLFTTLGDPKITEEEFKTRLARFDSEILKLRESLVTPGSPYRALSDSIRATKS